jgi:hypothetical protein
LPFAAACAGEPELEFADWLFPVPEGAALREYPAVAASVSEPGPVQMIEDMVIGGDPADADAMLYRPTDIAVAEDGSIFIADRGAHDIKAFAPDGSFRRTLGKQGQGPGEFTGLRYLAIAGDMLVAYDTRNTRFSVWTLAGEHVADHKPPAARNLSSLLGLADGTLIWTHTQINDDRTTRQLLVRSTISGEELGILLDRAGSPLREVSAEDPRAMLQTMLEWLEDPRFLVAVGNEDVAYFSPGTAYQLLAMSSDGTPRWALRRAGPPATIPQQEKGPLIEAFLRLSPWDTDVAVDELTWPEQIPSILHLRVDGAGRLHLFVAPPALRIAFPGLQIEPSDSWPVHVYSADGQHIAAGSVPALWSYARGDHVYELGTNANDDPVVVRYRLTVERRP